MQQWSRLSIKAYDYYNSQNKKANNRNPLPRNILGVGLSISRIFIPTDSDEEEQVEEVVPD